MPTPPALPAEFLSAIAARFPSDFLLREPAELAEFGRDWTRVHEPAPSAIALPRSTAEVSALLGMCHAFEVPVVPSGGRTGLAGGAMATAGELVLSLSRMARIDAVDPVALTVRVEAGAVLQAVHQACAEHGLQFPIDLAAKGSSQLGGNIATNAGGVRVVRYGLTRQWVLGLEVVTAAGEVLELGGALEKNNTGCDLRQLFIGSEGTLGVITAATLKLTRLPKESCVLLCAATDLSAILRLFAATRSPSAPFVLSAYELITEPCLRLVVDVRGLRSPFPLSEAPSGTCYALIEVEPTQGIDAIAEWLAGVSEAGLISDGVLAQNAREAAELWALRESISETLSRTGLLHKNDVALPIAALGSFVAELERFFAATYPDWDVFVFGHIGDGNLHVNVRKPAALSAEDFRRRTSEVDHALFRLVQAHRGSISAEHGIGLLKKPYLRYSRSPEELALLRAIKRALDPKGILNPGKIFD